MKKILCYGDSNTYGYIPGTGERYTSKERWTGILQDLLGDGFCVIEEGLNGRTTVLDDPEDPFRNGAKYFEECIKLHYPIDLIIIMLGTNDLKLRFNATSSEIANGAGTLVKIALSTTEKESETNDSAEILLVSPIHVAETMNEEEFGYIRSHKISKELAPKYEKISKSLGVEFMNAALITEASKIDSLHLSKKGHKDLAKAFEKICREILT
ncbi:SGNH/GDSL hydrolase family protein [Clostridium septicum]|uniref:Lipase n=1 Tax=Clostridium septicum TaxID=1504 RepID=A0A9N7JIM5_CLOSE|nr:SGNH/GDSL hydrolase family protein [Clostridium septicum]AYE33269.1 lipase [Clostridium septicum]MDU1312999.1 SGNH/GDSL hydrolase family protein [Clostridium septicum]QAS61440.1 lipase [Clostridium septicum]UEC22126.1 SGNH/GDSL hydrolase family protein [Clostridium septicum]USR99843.1 SGNH/GDSL hydrolase family protein [Clostridium septicum]